MDNIFCLQITIIAYQMANNTGMDGIQKKEYFGKMVLIFIITQYTVTTLLRTPMSVHLKRGVFLMAGAKGKTLLRLTIIEMHIRRWP
jgi:hypothetical protein